MTDAELLAVVLREIEEAAEQLTGEDPIFGDEDGACDVCEHQYGAVSRLVTLAAKIRCRVVVS